MEINKDELKDLYKDADSRLNTVVSPDKYEFWRMLRKIHGDYYPDLPTPSKPVNLVDKKFVAYVEEKWGIKIHLDPQTGGILADHTIMDEEKYLLAILKFK